MVEKVDYTTRFERSNRRNIEAANRRVPSDYTPRQKIERAVKPYWEGLNRLYDTLSEKTGIASFANKLRNFQQARKKYSTDQGTEQGLGQFLFPASARVLLPFLEGKSPYEKDISRWLGNLAYNTAEFGGDVLEMGWRSAGTFLGEDLIPGDAGVGGEWWEMQKYNPNIETVFGTLPKPFWGSGKYDPDAATELQQAMGQAERASGLNLKNETDWTNILQNTNYQNHLRNYGLDLKDVKKEDLHQTVDNFYLDKFYNQFSEEMTPLIIGDTKYMVPQEWKDNYEGYTDRELGETFDKDFASFSIKESGNIYSDYQEGAQEKYNKKLMDQFGFSADQLAYAESAMDPKKEKTDIHMGLFEDFMKESTMPFMDDLAGYTEEGYPKQFLDYETPEAKELSTSEWSTAPEWLLYSPMFKGIKKASGIMDKATRGTKAGAINKLYQNLYPGLSGSGGPIPIFNFPSRTFTGAQWRPPGRSKWQFPATTYGASLRETGDE